MPNPRIAIWFWFQRWKRNGTVEAILNIIPTNTEEEGDAKLQILFYFADHWLLSMQRIVLFGYVIFEIYLMPEYKRDYLYHFLEIYREV